MRKSQFPRRANLDKNLTSGRTVLVHGAEWDSISNIIAHFRRKGQRVHSKKLAQNLFLLYPEWELKSGGGEQPPFFVARWVRSNMPYFECTQCTERTETFLADKIGSFWKGISTLVSTLVFGVYWIMSSDLTLCKYGEYAEYAGYVQSRQYIIS